MLFNGPRGRVEEESQFFREAQDEERFQEREVMQYAFRPRQTATFSGPLDKECPSMHMVLALSRATDRVATSKPDMPRAIRGPRAWIRHTHIRSTTPTQRSIFLSDDKPRPPPPPFRTAGRGSWSVSNERVVLALASKQDMQLLDKEFSNLSVSNHMQDIAAMQTSSDSERRLLMFKSNPSREDTSPSSSPARPKRPIWRGGGSPTSSVAPSNMSAPTTGSPQGSFRRPSLFPQRASLRSGEGWLHTGGLQSVQVVDKVDARGQHISIPLVSRIGSPTIKLTVNPERHRQPRGGPNCTVEPLFLDGHSSFSPEYQLSHRHSQPVSIQEEQKKHGLWHGQIASWESTGWYSSGAVLQRTTDQFVSPALRHGRAEPARMFRLRTSPSFQNADRRASAQDIFSFQSQEYDGQTWGDSYPEGQSYDPQSGELNPLVPSRMTLDDLEIQRQNLLRQATYD